MDYARGNYSDLLLNRPRRTVPNLVEELVEFLFTIRRRMVIVGVT